MVLAPEKWQHIKDLTAGLYVDATITIIIHKMVSKTLIYMYYNHNEKFEPDSHCLELGHFKVSSFSA